jgi:esterase/lipase
VKIDEPIDLIWEAMTEKFKSLERPLNESGIREGCEKKIVWYDDVRQRRDLAIVYVHGFSASRMETWPLCDRLAAALGANLFYTRLSGHGQDGQALGRATVTDWLADGLEAIDMGTHLGRRIILVGMSTGGTLATWLAAQPSVAPHLHSLILLSPNFMPKNPLALVSLWPPGLRWSERLFGSWRCFTAINSAQSRFWTVRYPLKAIATMMQLVHRSWQVDLHIAAMPVLMMLNPWDRVINVTLAVARFSRFPSPAKKLVWFRKNRDLGRHVLAGQILSPGSTDAALGHILDFVQSVERDQEFTPGQTPKARPAPLSKEE